MLTGQLVGSPPPKFEVIVVTDCEFLRDALLQLTPSLAEKRTATFAISIRDEVSAKNAR